MTPEKQSYRTLYNFLLPFVIIVAFLLRINLLSFVYFVFGLFLPLIVSPPTSQYPGHPYRFIICITLWSIVSLVGQLLFNFVPWEAFLSHPLFPYDRQITSLAQSFNTSTTSFLSEVDCHPFSRWLRQIGLDKIQPHWTIPRTLNLFVPDLLVFSCGALLLFRLKILQRRRRIAAVLEATGDKTAPRKFSQVAEYLRIREWAKRFENYHNAIFAVGCCIVGAFHPSLLSIPYFFMFIILATLWAFDRPLQRGFWFNCRRGLLIYCALHLSILYIYQLSNVYRNFPSYNFIARALGLVHYQTFPCDRVTYPLPIVSWIWPEYLAPFVTYLFYYLVATQVSIIKEKEELAEVDSLFHKAGGAVAALVMKSQDGSRIALGYQIKDTGPRKESTNSVKVPLSETPVSSKKTSVTSLPSNTSKKSAKISLHFAEKLAAMKLERERMKNLAKWENLKPILDTLKSQSYVVSLIVLMAWSLCYHSWSTFVMLILSFIIWMHPNSQKFYHQIATFIVAYAEILLVFQFAFSLPFTQEELPDEKPAFLRQLGLEKPRKSPPIFDILLKALFNLAFWYALKQKFIQERLPKPGTFEALEKPKIVVESDTEKVSLSSTESVKRPLFERIKAHISNFWIFLVLILLLIISMYNPVVFYRIGYMAFFLVFLGFFVISFPLWRKMLHKFWIIMIAYCTLVVTLIYTYQFHGIPELYADYLGMSEPVAKSLGLERFSSSQLLFRLLTPISFLIVSLIQLNFFHQQMLEATAKWEEDVYGLKLRFLMAKLKLFHRQMNYLESGLMEGEDLPEDVLSEEEVIKGLAPKQRMKKVIGEIERLGKQMLSYRQSVWNILWRIAEIHIDRVIAGFIVYTAVKEISFLNLPLIICVVLLLPFQTNIPTISDAICVISGIIVLLKMLYQMEFIKESDIEVTCMNVNYANGTAVNSYGIWFGLTKVPSIFDYTRCHIAIVLLLVFRELIKIRQFLHRKRNRLEEPLRGILFPGINRAHADEDAFHCMLYFANYFFYKFGVELTFIAAAISIGIRNDLLAVFYVLWLLYMLTRTRVEMARLWVRYAGFHMIAFGIQYVLCVGMPRFLCVNYFWDDWDSNLIEWLCLPSFKVPPMPEKLFADFVVLLCITSQYYVFKLEEKFGSEYPGGDNQTLSSASPNGRRFIFTFDLSQFRVKSSQPLGISKVPDFISDGATLLDKFKHVFFMYFYWITLSIIFIAGTTRITLFAAGYVFGCFLFLWMGNSLFFKPIIVCLQMWDNLIYYNVCVILLKTLLQIVGCVYMGDMCKHFCWVLQLFGIACNKAGYSPIELVDPEVLIQCDIPLNEAGIFYDNLCFVFLLIQRRIFGSEYFKHVIAELKAQRFFASRGAELIEKINKQEIEEAESREKEMMKMVDTMVTKISKKAEKTKQKDPEGIFSEASSPKEDKSMDVPNEAHDVTIKEALMLDVQGPSPINPSPTSPLSTQLSPTSEEAETMSVSSLEVSKPMQRQLSADYIRNPQQQNLDELYRRKSANPRITMMQKSEDESDSWSINSSDRPQMKSRRKTTGEGGVKGLGPLQLLNFAIKKGAIRDAVNESNAIEATHEQMEKEMEMTQGSSDYYSIRKRIMKDKARQRLKPDFDEDTFEAEALTNVSQLKNAKLIAPTGASVKVGRIYSADTSEPTLTLLSPDGEDLFASPELDKDFVQFLEERKKHLSKKERVKLAYEQFKTYVKEYAKLLAMFLGMFARGTVESLICYLMRLSRDYRYIAYILQEEKRIHKELFSQSMNVGAHVSKITRHQQRAMIREKLQEKYDKSGFLKDEGIRKLHQYVEETEVREDSEAFDAPIPDVVAEVIHEELAAEKAEEEEQARKAAEEAKIAAEEAKSKASVTSIASESLKYDSKHSVDSKFSKGSVESKEVAIIQPAIIVQHDSEEDTAKVVHVPQAVVEVPRASTTPSQSEFIEICEEARKAMSEPPPKPKKEEYLLVRLVIAIYYAIISRSELICYIMIILNHIQSASLLSMPLPFMMLLWGTLTVPLPTKRFWITVISYTEGMVILKYIFQFGFFPWNHSAPSLDPFWLPRILGIEKNPNYAIWDLALLMTLFLHRNILMATGLWRNTKKEDEEEDAESYDSDREEHSKGSETLSLAPPVNPKDRRGSIFSKISRRRLTQISFTSVTRRFKKESIKRNVEHKVTRVQGFFGILLHPVNRVPVDMYAPMFLCDIICFMIVIFGYSSFGTDQAGGSVAAYFEENKVPGTLVAMLILQFVLIVADRALFLRKFLFGKLCFQLLLVIFVHIWIFFLLPAATDRLFINNFTCKLWYFVKSIYFLISAKQIRCGYPKFSVGNVLTRNYNYLNYALKNCYMKVPFLYELGVLTDWIWKDTSLALGDWITLHDIHQNIARLKCIRKWEEDFPSPKGVKQRPFIKYGYGGVLLVLIILIIWFPLVLFSMANTVGTRSTPVMCTCRLSIAGYQPLFDSTAQLGDIQPLTPVEYEALYYKYRTSKTALSYIADYTNLDVVKATINGNSASQWQISPPAREYLMQNLNSSNPMSMQFEWNFKRAPDENLQYGVVEDFRIIDLPPGDKIRQELIAMIDGNSTTPILIPDLFPSMVKVPGEGKAEHVDALLHEQLKGRDAPIESAYADVMLELISANGVEYWRLKMIDTNFDPVRKLDPIIRDDLLFYGFVDKVFPKSFSFITGGGILGLYISIVFLLGQYIRGFVVDSMQSIMFEELPNVDKILDLCHKIFFVRDVSRFDLEEALYANLVFIFRSPATLIRWTKERPV